MKSEAFDFGSLQAVVNFLRHAYEIGNKYPSHRSRIAKQTHEVIYAASDEQFAMVLHLSQKQPIDERSANSRAWQNLDLFFEDMSLFDSLYQNEPNKEVYSESAWRQFLFVIEQFEKK
ncbi:MAG TPA: hypothetical protein VD907_04770 [Verrucomicrobiae bacterium]|nr:hypothetical protein [Verrucomicrobiae bacterium]